MSRLLVSTLHSIILRATTITSNSTRQWTAVNHATHLITSKDRVSSLFNRPYRPIPTLDPPTATIFNEQTQSFPVHQELFNVSKVHLWSAAHWISLTIPQPNKDPKVTSRVYSAADKLEQLPQNLALCQRKSEARIMMVEVTQIQMMHNCSKMNQMKVSRLKMN
jgi:hypothetical protein